MRNRRPFTSSALAMVAALAALLAACASPGPTTDPAPIREAVLHARSNAAVDGPGVEIDEAIASASGEPVLVNGALFVYPDGSAALCSAMLESFPPQCGGSRLTVRGLDETMVGPLEEAQGLRWAERVQLFGTVELIRADEDR